MLRFKKKKVEDGLMMASFGVLYHGETIMSTYPARAMGFMQSLRDREYDNDNE